jgi:hypothetical protein
MFKIVRGEYDGERMPHKRLKHATEDRINLPAPALPDSPESSTKASEDEPSGRRKNPRARVTQRELNDYVDIEKGWLDPSLSRCRKSPNSSQPKIGSWYHLRLSITESMQKWATYQLIPYYERHA